ncbi:metallophosphoesterase [Streptomyces sp. H10-C2]|uniref:metallophosphoesterase family protein n=1 Tax=unclassified Streptomyces TaxID=2593676 RepID=UPI0024B9627C|nr:MULTISPECIES: metallophosphoesterase [unclassified Streptomyces]MDJ0343615.1 metallophosphoesterase [Streptomyces sp. PH10-H1]MDJ0373137.1 metallophosphoesterase [Streptomyces sp. H10-C2]
MSDSSRDSAAGAGWHGQQPGRFRSLMPAGVTKLSWLNPATLWSARNGPLASLLGDPTNDDRRRWVARQRGEQPDRGSSPDFVIERDDPESYSFMLIADTGEGDAPQYAVVPGFLEAGAGTRFAVLSSDVIYPVGSVNDYGPKFFQPYKDYDAPIYAVPGNHDWYDGLTGFMRVFCDAPALPPAARPKPLSAGWWRGLLWKSSDVADERRLDEARLLRSAPAQQAMQPGPYWAIDSGPLRIIGIDTGLLGSIDKEQGEWLRRVSQGPGPKILVTGSPIYVDDKYHPCAIEGGGTVDEIVRNPACHYVAAIGGDIHNYQHYPVNVDGRTIEYIVCGGGGAFMHATHTIPRVAVAGVTEQDFRCYPLRGDSLAFYSKVYGRRLRMKRFFELTAEQASAVIAKRFGIPPTRTANAPVTLRARLVATLLGVPSRPHGRSWFRLPVHKIYSRVFSSSSASYSPPFFKSFLRLDVTPGSLRIRCFAATGYPEQEIAPPVEDEITIPLG